MLLVVVIAVCMYVYMYVYMYVCMYTYVYLQSKAIPTELSILWLNSSFLSRITQLEQCVSSPFVFVYRKVEWTDQALIEIRNP